MPMATPTKGTLSVMPVMEEVSTDSPVEMSMREISTRIIGMEKENSSSTMDLFIPETSVWEALKGTADMTLKVAFMMDNGSEMNTMERVNSSTRMEAIILDDSSEDRLMALERSGWQTEQCAVDCGSVGSSCKNAPKRNVKKLSPRVRHAPNWVENRQRQPLMLGNSQHAAQDYMEHIRL